MQTSESRLAILLASRNRPDQVERLVAWIGRNVRVPHDVIVVEAGTDVARLTAHTTVHYEDPEFRGFCLAHNMALEHARERGRVGQPFTAYWVLQNDIVLPEGVDVARALLDVLEREPDVAVVEPGDDSTGAAGAAWRPVAAPELAAFMVRAKTVDEIGFLNPEFRYGVGATLEFAYHLHHAGWRVARMNTVRVGFVEETTYGVAGTNTIPAEEFERRAQRFAYAYFAKVYGPGWDGVFWNEAAPSGAQEDVFGAANRHWAATFNADELASLATSRPMFAPQSARPAARHAAEPTVQVAGQSAAPGSSFHDSPLARAKREPAVNCETTSQAPSFGESGQPQRPAHSGQVAPMELWQLAIEPRGPRRTGWVHVAEDAVTGPDVVAPMTDLSMFPDTSCRAIEALDVLQRMAPADARLALGEWRRLLVNEGTLVLEVPHLERCLAHISTSQQQQDAGLAALFGIAADGTSRASAPHRWAWSPHALVSELLAAGFGEVREEASSEAPIHGNDPLALRLVATVGACLTSVGASPNVERGVIVPPGVTPEAALLQRIDALHPWFYPVELGGLTVLPGIDSEWTSEWLAVRAAARAQLLVEGVLRRVDVRGKSVLELASSCGFWSSFYAQAGARRVIGIEGDPRHVEQARLYWGQNRFLPEDAYDFNVGNVTNAGDWSGLRDAGPFDVTLCLGILHQVPNPDEVLQWAAEVTNELLIVDTRVRTSDTTGAEVPDREALCQALRTLGFEPQALPVRLADSYGIEGPDDYSSGARVVLLARKVRVPENAGAR